MIKLVKRYLIIFKIFSLVFLLSNCSSTKSNREASQLSDIEIYSEGLVSLKKGDLSKAILQFDDVFLNYPFSSLSSKSEIMSAYSLYQNNEIEKTIAKLNSYIEMNPKGEMTEYAHYLLAMCYYSQVSNENRDPDASIKSLNYFKLITTKYPNTKYAKDAKLKIHFLKNTLAKNELNVGKFYLRKGAPASSIKRFKSILQNYQNTSVIPEALYRLSEAFLIIGLKDEAIKSIALLDYNFPQNDWTKLSKSLLKNKSELNQQKNNKFSIINYFKDFF
tara:strand:- start:407 stop:1234 length:828 start_codon:yes stop_codon:yes gene_type:complete